MTPLSMTQNRFIPPSWEGWMNDRDFSSECESAVESGERTGTQLFTRTYEDWLSYPCSSCLNIAQDNVLPPQCLTIVPMGTYFKRNIGQVSGRSSFITINKIATGFSHGAIVLNSIEDVLESLRTDISKLATTLITQSKLCVTEAAKFFINKYSLNTKINNVIEIICGTYSTLKFITLDAKNDPEITERERLHLILTISGEPSTVLEEEQLYKKMVYEKEGAGIFELLIIRYRWS